MLFNFVLKYSVRKDQENEAEFVLSGRHVPSACDDNVVNFWAK
jgi:hypothetical protein